MDEGERTTGVGGDARNGTDLRADGAYVSSAEVIDREVRAMRRWHLRRPVVWRSWALSWVASALGVVLVVEVSRRAGLTSWGGPTVYVLFLVVLALIMLLDALVLLPWRVSRLFRRIVAAQCPPGTPVRASFDATAFTFATPDASYTIATDAITGGTWADGVLVLDTRTDKFYVLAGELFDPRGWLLVNSVLGPRLRTL
ncbi:MAG TPA: hypothetical protein VFL46_04765 [Phycicoccus sp.]|nr:hypothetical protein [Phycicoccus sp.]